MSPKVAEKLNSFKLPYLLQVKNIAWNTLSGSYQSGMYISRHSGLNSNQHSQTLSAVSAFRTLPLSIGLPLYLTLSQMTHTGT